MTATIRDDTEPVVQVRDKPSAVVRSETRSIVRLLDVMWIAPLIRRSRSVTLVDAPGVADLGDVVGVLAAEAVVRVLARKRVPLAPLRAGHRLERVVAERVVAAERRSRPNV